MSDSARHVVDSSAWLEYFADGPNAEHFAPIIEQADALLVPSITVLEVFKAIARQRDESTAIRYTAVIQQSETVDLSADLAMRAAILGLKHRLPLADSIVYATGQAHDALVWTQDADFDGLEGVRYVPKPRGRPQ